MTWHPTYGCHVSSPDEFWILSVIGRCCVICSCLVVSWLRGYLMWLSLIRVRGWGFALMLFLFIRYYFFQGIYLCFLSIICFWGLYINVHCSSIYWAKLILNLKHFNHRKIQTLNCQYRYEVHVTHFCLFYFFQFKDGRAVEPVAFSKR